MKTILKPLKEIHPKREFSVGIKLLKRIKGKEKKEFQEYKLIRANWDGEYMMLIRKLGEKSNKTEYGIIPEKLESGKAVVNKSSFQRTLGKTLTGWFLIEKNRK